MKTPLYIEPLDWPQAAQTLRDYVCSSCWGHLLAYHAPGRLYWVLCHYCGPDSTRGYTSKATVEIRRAESRAEYLEAAEILRDLIPGLEPEEKQTPEQIIKDLGF